MYLIKGYGQQKIFYAHLKVVLKSFSKLFYGFNISCSVFEIFRLEKGRSPPSTFLQIFKSCLVATWLL
jgi:hypothetical protein